MSSYWQMSASFKVSCHHCLSRRRHSSAEQILSHQVIISIERYDLWSSKEVRSNYFPSVRKNERSSQGIYFMRFHCILCPPHEITKWDSFGTWWKSHLRQHDYHPDLKNLKYSPVALKMCLNGICNFGCWSRLHNCLKALQGFFHGQKAKFVLKSRSR